MFDISKMSLRQKINQTIVVLMEKEKKLIFAQVPLFSSDKLLQRQTKQAWMNSEDM